MEYILLIIGFVILILGGNWLVSGASAIATKMNVSQLVIGLTVVAFGTSLPELVVNLYSSANGANEAVYGNIIGSNLFNILFIIGVAGLIYPIRVSLKSVAYEIPFSILCVVLLFVISNDSWLFGSKTQQINRVDSFLLLLSFGVFLFYIFRSTASEELETTGNTPGIASKPKLILMIIAGLGMLIGGGYLATNNAQEIARNFGLSEKLIALTILSVGTSLPELVTSATAAFKGNSDIAIGNVIGSNIFNILFILGINGLVKPVGFNAVLNWDMLILLVSSMALMMFMFTGKRYKLDRWEALLMILAYVLYCAYIINRN